MEHPPQGLGALLVEGVAGSHRARGDASEGVQTPFVEVVYGVAGRLGGAPEVFGDPRGALSPRARQEYLASAHGEGVLRAQPLLETFLFLFRQRTYEDWSFHGAYCNPSNETYPDDALGKLEEHVDRFVKLSAIVPA